MTYTKALLIVTLPVYASLLTGCAPAVVGGGATVGVAATKEKGVAGAWEDTKISSAIKVGLYQKDPDIHRLVNVNVQNGEVLLTGAVPTQKMHLDAVKISWEPKGVKRVIDKISESEGEGLGNYIGASWITTQLKTSLIFDGDIQSRNYSIVTIGAQTGSTGEYKYMVYIMGIAQDQEELDKVINHARNTNAVSEVVSYVRLKEEAE